MINELRGIGLKDLGKLVLYDNEVVGIGNEGCVHDCIRKFTYLLMLAEEDKLTRFRFRLVTPRMPEKYMRLIMNYLAEINCRIQIDSIVINDYGLLHALRKSRILQSDIILGRTLVRTLADVPWCDLILESENSELREGILQSNIMHLEKIELYKEYKVKGVELSPVKENETIIKRLHNFGIQSYVHFDNEIATIGRTCPRLRVENYKANECNLECDNSIMLEIFQPYGVSIREPERKNIYPLLYNVNNVIYHKKNVFNMFKYQISDGVIFDYRLCDAKVLNEERERMGVCWNDI